MSIPESIKKRKPTDFGALEIRCFGEGKYYIYQITSKWDAEKNRPKKLIRKSIRKITEAEEGFIPNANGLRLMKEMRLTPDVAPIVKNYGAYKTLQQLSPEIEEQLRKFFPAILREIRIISLLRLVDTQLRHMVSEILSVVRPQAPYPFRFHHCKNIIYWVPVHIQQLDPNMRVFFQYLR